MASAACVNNFLDCPPPPPPPSYAWLTPRGSTSPDPITHNPDPDSPADFEFRLEHPVTMLPADELFSDGKLLPLHLSNLKPSSSSSVTPTTTDTSPDSSKSHRRHQISISDPYLFSPKAPRCSSRWKELLGLKKLYQSDSSSSSSSNTASPPNKTTSSSSSTSSLKNFLHRRSNSTYNKSTTENAPLLSKEHQQQHSHSDSSSETLSISSSRLSLSSSSSSHDHDNDLPRLSLDSDKPNPNPISIHRNPNHPRIRLVKPRPAEPTPPPQYTAAATTAPNNRVGRSPIRKPVTESGAGGCRGVSVDSPRMNSSGKIVFQSLERSSSSPSSFNGGPHHNRVKLHRDNNRGMERSYSANVRVTPVLNVPVCSSLKSGSVFGFGQLFSSPQKKEAGASVNGNGNNGGSGSSSGNKGNQYRNRCDRS